MVHLNSSKIADFFSSFAGKSISDTNSGQPGQTAIFASGPGPAINTPGYNSEAEDLRWDEYGNPYIFDGTIH